MKHLKTHPGAIVPLPTPGKAPDQCHVFDKKSIDAVNAAIAAQRPLLLRGEPGTGKTQLARAAAKELGWAFIPTTVDAKSEADDLLYKLDAVTRLGEAQIAPALGFKNDTALRAHLAEKRYLHPGPLWWAFDWQAALLQAKIVGDEPPFQPDGGSSNKGCVLLIDEIDKADADLPNGLLEAFGSGRFHPIGLEQAVVRNEKPLLVVITTNEERALPDPFLRRCLVHHLAFEVGDQLVEQLVRLGKAHFPKVADRVLHEAAKQLRKDREACIRQNLPAPGLAEYLDLIRALTELARDDEDEQLDLLHDIKDFALQKHPQERL